MFHIAQVNRGYHFQQIFEGDVNQIPKKGHLPTRFRMRLFGQILSQSVHQKNSEIFHLFRQKKKMGAFFAVAVAELGLELVEGPNVDGVLHSFFHLINCKRSKTGRG